MLRRPACAAILLLLVSSLLPGLVGATPVGPDPGKVYIRTITYAGTGCPQGSVGMSIAADRLSFTLIFDVYVATVGPNIPASEAAKDCAITLTLHLPQGWEMADVAIDTRGYVQLATGRTAAQTITAAYPTNVLWRLPTATFTGPTSRDYLNHQTFAQVSSYSPCDGTQQVKIKTQNSIGGQGQGQGQITLDSLDGKITQIGGLSWVACDVP